MTLETLQQAYAAPGQRGSIFTLPLRSYHTWFRGQIAAAESPCQKVALQVAHFVLGIFATLLLGIPALVGMAFNLCATPLPPEAGVEAYSVWAQIWGVPTEAEAFIQKNLTAHKNLILETTDRYEDSNIISGVTRIDLPLQSSSCGFLQTSELERALSRAAQDVRYFCQNNSLVPSHYHIKMVVDPKPSYFEIKLWHPAPTHTLVD